MIASIFVVTMASPAVVALRYTAKPKRELALGSGSAQRRLTSAVEGSMILPVRVPEYVSATPGPRLLTQLTPINRRPVCASVDLAEDGISVSREDRENVMA
jgi:hypothetical protein